MSDGDALLAAILAQPDEDTPRLAFADWLDEQGGEANAARAEFIRLQVANVGNGGTYWSLTGRWSRPTRFKDLLTVQPWLEPKAVAEARRGSGYLQPSNSTAALLWRRGFVEAAYCSGVSLGPVLDDLRRHPVREVRLTNEPTADTISRLCPGWKYGNLFRFDEDRDALAMKLLGGPGGFPHLLHAGMEWQKISGRTCPFLLVGNPVAEAA